MTYLYRRVNAHLLKNVPLKIRECVDGKTKSQMISIGQDRMALLPVVRQVHRLIIHMEQVAI